MFIESEIMGRIEISENQIITMMKPILGYENLKSFCLVKSIELEPLSWLQSVEDPKTAFLVVDPKVVDPDYMISINPREVSELAADNASDIDIYSIVTSSDDVSDVTINLQGPILINRENNFGKQLVLTNSDYGIKHYLTDSVEEEIIEEVHYEEPVGV